MRLSTEAIGPFTLRQAPGVFPVCGDSLALGSFASARRGGQVCDLGCGSGVLGLCLLAREPSLRVTALELDGRAAALARENFAENGLDAQVLQGDLRQIRTLLPSGGFDLAVSNPPYFPPRSGRGDSAQRMELVCTLEDVCAAAAWLLKNGGRFALVHRPERLADVFCALRAHGLEPKRLRFLQTPGRPPSAALAEAVKRGRPGLKLEPAL